MYMPPNDTGMKPAAGAAGSGAGLPYTASNPVEGTVFAPAANYSSTTNFDVGPPHPHDKTFVENIYSLLHVPSYSSIISWNSTGTAVIIHDVDAFISTIMPVHFRHSQFSSFTRRMRRWGFRVTKKLSAASSSSVHREGNAMEFSSRNFLRDRPELCSLMKDERQAKKKFKFLDSTLKTADGMEYNQGSSTGVAHYPTSPSRISAKNPSLESMPPLSIHQPTSFAPHTNTKTNTNTNTNTAQSHLEPNQLQQSGALSSANLKSTGDADLNVASNYGGHLHNYPQEIQLPPMITPNKRSTQHGTVPTMNNMMPPPPLPSMQPPFQYPPYSYNSSSVGQIGQIGQAGQASPGFLYPPPYGYQPYQQHLQHHVDVTSQHYPPLPPTAASFFRNVDARASMADMTPTLSLSSSDESNKEIDLLPTRKTPNSRVQSQVSNEQRPQESNAEAAGNES